MLRTILLVLAFIVLILAILFYFRILEWPGSGPLQVNPVEIEVKQDPVKVSVNTSNGSQPAP